MTVFEVTPARVLAVLGAGPLEGKGLADALGLDFSSKVVRKRLSAAVAPLIEDGRVAWEVTAEAVRFEKVGS